MPVLASVSRLLIACLAISVSTVSFAADPFNTLEHRKSKYLLRCETLENRMPLFEQSKKSKDAAYIFQTFRDQIPSMAEDFAASSSLGLTADQAKRCNALFARVQGMLDRAQETLKVAEEIETKKERAAALVHYQNTPDYKLARSLGYEDVGHIGLLDLHEELDGEEKMRSMLFLVDRDCGSFFQAVQNTPPYVIYTIEKTVITCGKAKRIAVIGTSNVGNEDLIDEKATFEYVGREKIMSPNGFPISVRVVKQRPK